MVHELIQNARPFYPRDCDDPLIEEVVTEVAKNILLGNYQKQRKHLKYLLLDFRHRQIESPQGWIYCSRDKNSYLYYRA
jgi:hypothetical protein